MKKIIKGKVYDTDTAQEMGSWSNGGGWRDFHHVEETLYRKKTGEFFLHGEGGPATRYAVACGQNSWTGGSRIMPLAYREAKKWAEEHLDADDYEAIFGEVTEDGSKIQVCYTISSASVEKIKRRAGELGIPASTYLDSIIQAAD